MPEVEDVDVPEVKPEARFKQVIQPKDKDGNPIGQPHVYEADTEQELLDKMANAIANGTRKINELTREARLEPPKPYVVPEDAELDDETPEPRVRNLSVDEKFELAIQLRDPDTVDTALDSYFEAKFGYKPEDFAKREASNLRDTKAIRARQEADAFVEENPDYVYCPANSEVMLQYLVKNHLKPTKKNFEIAFRELSKDGLLILNSQPDSPDDLPPTASETRTVSPAPEVESRQRTVASTGLRRSNATATEPRRPKEPSAEEIEMMSPEEYKRYITRTRR